MAQRGRTVQKRSAGGAGKAGGGQHAAPESLAAKEKRDSFELQYQEALTLFCQGKRVDAFELWKLLNDNPLALHDTQRKVAVSLGQCYATGNGTAKDPLKAVEVFKKAVRLNSAQASLELGRCLRYQLCDDENSSSHASAAVRALADAARLGSVEAEYELGLCYLQVSESRV
jgi:TPR repeat protein